MCALTIAGAAAAAHADNAGDRAVKLQHSQTGGVIVNPYGLWLRHDIAVDTGLLPSLFGDGFAGDVRVGAFTQWLVYSNELGVRVSWLTNPELLILSVEGDVEPGLFVEAKNGRPPDDVDKRVGHLRKRLTAQATVNLKLTDWWLYSRSTAGVKLRDFVEYDPYQNVIVKDELDLEQATALMYRLTPLKTFARGPASLWVYAEYTVGALVGTDVRPNRLSLGLIAENFPSTKAALDIDINYSFANQPAPGPGVIALYGFAF